MEKIEISYKTIIFTALFLVFLWFLYQIREIIIVLFLVIILTAALGPVVNTLEKIKIPRVLSIILIYLLVVGVLVITIYSIVPPLIEQTGAFLNTLPHILETTGIGNNIDPNMLVPELASVPGGILKLVLGAFSNILAVFTVLVLTFYCLVERKNLPHYFELLFGDEEKEKMAINMVEMLEKNIGGWVRGELFLMLIVGVISYIGFRFLGLEFAAPLAVLAGFLELIPNIGPTVAAVPAILVGLSMSPALAIGALVLSITVQQFENHIIVPQVMRHVTGLNPVVTLICLLVGFKLWGPGGAILSIPAFLAIKTIIIQTYLFRRQSSKK